MKKGLKLKGGMPNSFGIRDCNIDIIRLIACAAVVGLHTFPKDLSLVTASLVCSLLGRQLKKIKLFI